MQWSVYEYKNAAQIALIQAGFNQGGPAKDAHYYSLPGSGGADAILLANQSDIGIPGEWLFRVDAPDVYLCGPGYKGIECIDQCTNSEWFFDCSKECHCEASAPCNAKTGTCTNGRCKGGWTNEPICDIGVFYQSWINQNMDVFQTSTNAKTQRQICALIHNRTASTPPARFFACVSADMTIARKIA
jgi:hypothetical protein